MGEWVARLNRAGRNIYFSVNSLAISLGEGVAKARKEDISHCICSHLDADPVRFETTAEDRESVRPASDAGRPAHQAAAGYLRDRQRARRAGVLGVRPTMHDRGGGSPQQMAGHPVRVRRRHLVRRPHYEAPGHRRVPE
jgi:hypothetical protein